MWQSLDINTLAKNVGLAPATKQGQTSAFSRQLRDFSIRKLPDEMVEILDVVAHEDDALENAETEPAEMLEELPADAPEMMPFDLGKGSKHEDEIPPTPDLEAIRLEAFVSGRQAAEQEYEAEREKLAKAHQQALEEVRQATLAAMADDLISICQMCFDQMQSDIEKNITLLIVPLIGERLEQQAVAEFTRELANEAVKATLPLVIEGKPALIDAFIAQAKKTDQINLAHYQFEKKECAELRIIYSDKVLSTRLQPLLQKLREII